MKLPPAHRRSSIQQRESCVYMNNSLVDHTESVSAPMICNPCSPGSSTAIYRNDDNSPQYQSQKGRDEDGEPLNEYSAPPEEKGRQQEYTHRKRQLQLSIELQPRTKRYRRFLCLPQRSVTVKPTHSASFVEDQDYHFNDNNYHTPIRGGSSCISSLSADESDYYVLDLAPAVQNNIQSPSFVEDQDNRHDDNNICSTPIDAASISSLSEDGSLYVFNLASVLQNNPPVRMMISDTHDRCRIDSKKNQAGSKDLCEGVTPTHHTFTGNMSRLQTPIPLHHYQTISTPTTPTITLIPSHSRIQQHGGSGNFTIINDTLTSSHDHQSKKFMSRHNSLLIPAVAKPVSISEDLRSKSEPIYIARAQSSLELESSKYNAHHSQTRRKRVRRVVRYVLTGMKAVLIKRKSYDFERSSGSFT